MVAVGAARPERHPLGRANFECLNEQLRLPSKYVERRTDRMLDMSRHCAHWHVAMQLHLPEVSDAAAVEALTLVSLGVFEKKRLPDLEVRDGTDALLSTMRRSDRTLALAFLLFHTLVNDLDEADWPSDDDQIKLVNGLRRIVAEPAPVAETAFAKYTADVRSIGLDARAVDLHLDNVEKFIKYTHVLAWTNAAPGDRIMVTYTFSDRHNFPEFANVWRTTREGNRARYLLRLLALRLGLLAVPIHLRLTGANHAHSFYLLARPPAGTELEALYWEELTVRQPATAAPIGTTLHESADYPLACYSPEHDVHGGMAYADIRINGPAIKLVWLLTIILAAAGVVGVTRDRTQLQDIISLLAVIPAGLLALITQSRNEFEYRTSEVIKTMCLILVLLAGLFGVAVSGDFITEDQGLLSDRHIAIALAGYGTFLAILLTAIAWRRPGPTQRSPDAATLQESDILTYRRRRRRSAYAALVAACLGGLFATIWLSRQPDKTPAQTTRGTPTHEGDRGWHRGPTRPDDP